jgi:hypothetical protein
MSTKKAQGLSINTIILIILGVVVLVALIFGFTKGWDGLKQWVAPSNNVNKIATECRAACTTGATYDWCTVKRTIKENGQTDVTKSCKEFADVENKNTLGKYGIEPCEINCPSPTPVPPA